MKVWVVGGAGYIGSHVCKALQEAGHQPVVFDNLSSGRRSNLPAGTLFRQGDLLDTDGLLSAAREFPFDGVIHLAALKAADESMREPERYSRNNIVGSLNLVEAVHQAGISRLVFSSTAAVYGEPDYVPIDEKHPVRPGNYYGQTKWMVESMLKWYGQLRGLRYVILRYFNAAGYDPEGTLTGLERNPANLLPVVMETAMGWRPKLSVYGRDYPTRDGTCVRDYIHVSDLAAAHVKSLEYLTAGNENLTLNLGSGTGITVMEMVKKAERITGREIPFAWAPRRPGDMAEVIASSALAADKLGWVPKFSDAESLLSTTWKAYQANIQAS